MAICPKCRKQYPDGVHACADDGVTLIPDVAAQALDKDLAAGQLVGEYRVEAKLGEGGFGSVYRAVQPVIGKPVAIKVLNRELSSNPEMVSRFVDEARAVNQIRSRHIIDIFAFGALPDGRQYFVMELLDGVTLEEHLHQHGRLSPGDAAQILRSVARALDAAHAAGVVHRDLKPENIFLVREDDGTMIPKLLDFGIAKLAGDKGSAKTRTGVPMGTPYYMSPEQCRGEKIDHRTDIYSLGVVTHQLITGALPFTADSFMQVLFKHASEPPPLPSAVCPDLGTRYDAPILAMLSKLPDQRPSRASQAIESFAACVPSGATLNEFSAGATVPAHVVVGAATPADLASLRGAGVPDFGERTAPPLETHAATRASKGPWLAVGGLVAVLAVGAAAFALTRAAPTPAPSAGPDISAVAVASTPAPAASPEVAPAPTPEPPSKVVLDIQSEPKAVEVYLGEVKLGALPGDTIKVERGDEEITLTLKAEGYEDSSLRVKPRADAVLSAKLKKLARSAPAPAPAQPKPKPTVAVPGLEF
ncbi:MAG: protein kinase [Polyangiaceae bacterium]